jgi:hypothetical protein
LERAKGIEPSYSAWKAAALPLSYARLPTIQRRHSRSSARIVGRKAKIGAVMRLPWQNRLAIEPPGWIGVWLSLVEHYVRDVGVAGSNPATPTISPASRNGLEERMKSMTWFMAEDAGLRTLLEPRESSKKPWCKQGVSNRASWRLTTDDAASECAQPIEKAQANTAASPLTFDCPRPLPCARWKAARAFIAPGRSAPEALAVSMM